MKQRTQSGKDRDGKSFKPYTASYRKQKAEEFGNSRPNLTRTGQMLNSISWKNIKDGIRFYFNSAEQNSKAFYNQKTRKFFGFTKRETTQLKKQLTKIITKNIKQF